MALVSRRCGVMRPDQLLNHYACAVCYGLLIRDSENRIVCSKYRAEHQGYVSQWFVSHYRDRSGLMYAEAKRIYSRTKYAEALGLCRAPEGAELEAALNRNKCALGRDDTGI